jgi:hypothetical protein
MSLFHCLGRTKGSVQARGTCIRFISSPIFRLGVLSTSPNPQAGGPPLYGCPRLLFFNIFASTVHIGGLFSVCNPRTRHASVIATHLSWITASMALLQIIFVLCLVLRKEGKSGLYCTVFVQMLTLLCIHSFGHKI